MGMTYNSSYKNNLKNLFNIEKKEDDDYVIALAGNPNTGKSTVFNALTGLKQHTGNWPGKTVVNTQGRFSYKDKNFIVVDLPGTYSLMASSKEEVVARDFICFGDLDATVIVMDATCIERNLNLVFQIMEITNKVLICLNLFDEAQKKNIKININYLSKKLGVPIIPTAARSNIGINKLKKQILKLCKNELKTNPFKITYDEEIEAFIEKTSPKLEEIFKGKVNSRWLSLRLLDGDLSIINSINKYLNVDFHFDK